MKNPQWPSCASDECLSRRFIPNAFPLIYSAIQAFVHSVSDQTAFLSTHCVPGTVLVSKTSDMAGASFVLFTGSQP